MVGGAHPAVRRRLGNVPGQEQEMKGSLVSPPCPSATRCSPERAVCREGCPRLTAPLGRGRERGHSREGDGSSAFLCGKSFATLFFPRQSGNSQSGQQGASVQLGTEDLPSLQVSLLFPLTCGTNGCPQKLEPCDVARVGTNMTIESSIST